MWLTSSFLTVRLAEAVCKTVAESVLRLRLRGVFRITELSNDPNDYEIRTITPRESFMIQGMTMEDCDKASAVGISNSQLYKQAGNGLTSNVVSLLFEHIYKAFYDENYVCLDEKMVADGYGIGDDCPYGEEEDGQLTLWGLMDD